MSVHLDKVIASSALEIKIGGKRQIKIVQTHVKVIGYVQNRLEVSLNKAGISSLIRN